MGDEQDSTWRLGEAALESSEPQAPVAGAEPTGTALAAAEGRMGWKS
jgi:hypothetical protein